MAEQGTAVMAYNAAMGLALIEEMRRDERVFVLGQGVATGGWFGAEKGLADEFGRDRVIDSNIAEAFEAGVAAGAAIVGMKPVGENKGPDTVDHCFAILFLKRAVVPVTRRPVITQGE